MTKRGWISLLGAILVFSTGCDTSGEESAAPASKSIGLSSEAQTIIVDSQHQLRDQGNAGQPYLLSAAPGLVLDATRFPLRDPDRRARPANTIRIIYDNSILIAAWPSNGRQAFALDRSTLKLAKGKDFAGFKPATQAYIAIGYQEAGPSADEAGFIPFWMTSVVFR